MSDFNRQPFALQAVCARFACGTENVPEQSGGARAMRRSFDIIIFS
jgi:hypothetical protein